MERFLPAIFGLPNAINKTEQRGGCWFCGGWAWCTAGLAKRKQGEKANRALRACLCNIYDNVDCNPLFFVYFRSFRSSQHSFLIFHQSLRRKKTHLLVCTHFQAAGTVSNSSIFKGVEPSQGIVKLHHPFSNNHIHTFSEVLCSVRHHKSKCPEARRNWLCCRFLDFLVPERGISYPGLNPRTQSPVGEKKYGLSWVNVIYDVRINKYFCYISHTCFSSSKISLGSFFNASSLIIDRCIVLTLGQNQSLQPPFCFYNNISRNAYFSLEKVKGKKK